MNLRAAASGIVAVLALAPGCGSTEPDAADKRVTGRVSYAERILLPPETELLVEVSDPLQRGITDGVVARQRKVIGGVNPATFDLTVSAERFIPSHRYELEARVIVGGNVWAKTPEPVPVPAGGAPSDLDVIVRR